MGRGSARPWSRVIDEQMRGKRLTNKEVARLAGIPPSTLCEWRKGSHPRDFQAVLRLSRVLEVSIGHLLTGERDE